MPELQGVLDSSASTKDKIVRKKLEGFDLRGVERFCHLMKQEFLKITCTEVVSVNNGTRNLIVTILLILSLSLSACSHSLGEIHHPWETSLFENIRMPFELLEDTPYGDLAIQYIAFMNDNMDGRLAFTNREKETAIWLIETLLTIGYTWENIKIQEFSDEIASDLWPQHDWFEEGYQTEAYSQNVILTVPGQSDQIIIVGAHYDSHPFPGASDNASGVALLLESAYRMLLLENYYTLVYVFFGAEEVGSAGSHYYVNALSDAERDNILFMINADALFEGPYLLYCADYVEQGKMSVSITVNAWNDIAYRHNNLSDIEIIKFPDSSEMPFGDHKAFFEVGVPVVLLIGLDKRDNGEYWLRSPHLQHTPQDCMHYISETWDGKIDRAMLGFSIFLEEMLLHSY